VKYLNAENTIENMCFFFFFGLTSTDVNGEERPQCFHCMNFLAAWSIKSNKFKRHLETVHVQCFGKTPSFPSLPEKTKLFWKNSNCYTKITASLKVAYRIAKCRKPHWSVESLVSPLAATDVIETVLGESYAKELRKVPLTDNTVGRRIYRIFHKNFVIN
jgi:hypothetical protein